MNQDKIRSSIESALSVSSADRKLYLLSVLAHNLTISVRWVYSEKMSEEQTATKLYTLNEIQHTITGRLIRLASEEVSNESNDTFVESLFNYAQKRNCGEEFFLALKYTLLAIQE